MKSSQLVILPNRFGMQMKNSNPVFYLDLASAFLIWNLTQLGALKCCSSWMLSLEKAFKPPRNRVQNELTLKLY